MHSQQPLMHHRLKDAVGTQSRRAQGCGRRNHGTSRRSRIWMHRVCSTVSAARCEHGVAPQWHYGSRSCPHVQSRVGCQMAPRCCWVVPTAGCSCDPPAQSDPHAAPQRKLRPRRVSRGHDASARSSKRTPGSLQSYPKAGNCSYKRLAPHHPLAAPRRSPPHGLCSAPCGEPPSTSTNIAAAANRDLDLCNAVFETVMVAERTNKNLTSALICFVPAKNKTNNLDFFLLTHMWSF